MGYIRKRSKWYTVTNNLDKYKKDLEVLVTRGKALQISMAIEYMPNFLDDLESKKRKLFENFPKLTMW